MKRFQDGRCVLVTGGARGLGAAIVRRLSAEGARVILSDVLDPEGVVLATDAGADFLHLDVTVEADWVKAIAHAEALGGLRGLVNNAGVYDAQPILETPPAVWRRHMDVNAFGTFLGLRACAQPIGRAGGGAIVNIGSIAGLRAPPDAAAYGASKWAIRGLTKSAAQEFGRLSVRVNSVHPGLSDTPMTADISPERKAARAAVTPLRRIGAPNDVAEAVLFLLSDDASFVTGAELTVDGGLHAVPA